MNGILRLLTALVILAIAQMLTTALAILLLMLAMMGALARPRETLGFAACLGFLLLVLNAPIACAAALGAIGLVIAVNSQVGGHAASPRQYQLLLANRAGRERPP